MSSLFRVVVALSLPVIAVLSVPGCGGSTSATCDGFCTSGLGCIEADSCVLVDPDAAKSACVESCSIGFAALDAAETQAVDGCLSCLNNAAQGLCYESIPDQHVCDEVCDTDAVEAAGKKWSAAQETGEPPAGGECTNGRNVLGSSECQGSSTSGACDIACCNGSCGAVPDVSASCDTNATPASCTCTEGKNKGKAFTTDNPCSGNELWNECNL